MSVPKQRIYLDYNASSPVHPEVIDAVHEALKVQGNASSIHMDGRAVRASIERAREDIGLLIGAPAQSITFVSGGTEANSTVINGVKALRSNLRILGSSIEHPSVLAHIPENNRVAVDSNGTIDLDNLSGMLAAQNGPFLFCMMLANNETGVIQPVAEVAEWVHKVGGLVLCDAVQGLGKLPLDLSAIGADFYTFSGHKIGGPQGVGCIVNPKQIEIASSLSGGGQERGKRAGTENLPGIVGFGMAAHVLSDQFESYRSSAMRDQLETALLQARPDAIIAGGEAQRLSNTTNISLPTIPSERQVIKLDLAGYSVSAGSACSSGRVEASHVLIAMGLSPEVAESAIRVSIGPSTTWADLERFVAEWAKL